MAVLRVPQDYETIQEATDAAKPGDTIVADATYSAQEYVTTETDDLTVGAGKAAQQITLNLQGDATRLTLVGDAPIRVYGSEKGSVIQGNAGDNVIEARSSDADTIDGGDGNDVIVTDNPFFESGGADRLSGGRGNDTFKLSGGVDEGAVIDGGDGVDTVEIGDLTTLTVKNVEILDGHGHRGTVAQYRSFEKFINSSDPAGGIDIFIDGAGGALDFSTSVMDGLSVGVRATSATSGVNITASSNSDRFYGSDYADTFNGGKGNDTIYASGGHDTLNGGAGNDVFYLYFGLSGNVMINDGDGIDTLNGDAGNDVFYLDFGLSGNVAINGGDGIDTINSNTSLQGYDIHNVELLNTTGIGATIDQFKSFKKIYSDNGLEENIYLTLQGDGGVIDFRPKIGSNNNLTVDARFVTSGTAIIGSSGNDLMFGSAFDDRLDGSSGADRLTGNQGDDTFIVDDRGDLVFEDAGKGTDTVVTRVSYALQAGQEIEQLRAGGGVGSAAIDLTGNEFAQTIQGTVGANVLDGQGGADLLYGYGGNDTYLVDDAGDQVFESRGGGSDTVLSSTSYALQAGQEIETLQLLASTKNAALNLTGNDFAQTLIGNNGVNVLDGQGGADTLIGRGGNDTYIVDSKADRVVEAAGGGRDTVVATTSYQLGTGQAIETLQLAKSTGTAGYVLVGNALDNTIIGNAGDNRLDGRLGNDLLKGGAGADTFVFATTLGPDNVDRIADFSHTDDAIRLAKSVFSALAPGHLAEGAFKDLGVAGATVDADDRILYDHSTGDLSYDADGSGTAFAAIRFAVVDNHARTPLDHTDMLIA
ncbi:MAG: calcium-binding protein [Methylorubrum rhodinum]|uniref:calcium-binding protein n=1 Tax=Methylorubrum rhodinum TaxID=29428 RepID=UPI003BB05EE7